MQNYWQIVVVVAGLEPAFAAPITHDALGPHRGYTTGDAMNICLNCGAETKNPKFCTMSCAATYNNKLHPKRISRRKCIVCGGKTLSYAHARCAVHYAEFKARAGSNKTIGELRHALCNRGKHRSWLHASVRKHARHANRGLLQQPCAKCGYAKHVELAHVKALTSFPDDTPLRVVNAAENVIQLCPNCHWEFDNLPRA